MRRILQIILLKPILWASSKFASNPQPEKINKALSNLWIQIENKNEKKGPILKLNPQDKFIVFSDQHRGAKNGADDFMNAEPNYLAALDYYFLSGYQFISLGDCEELWENTLHNVRKHNAVSFESEKRFVQQNRFYKVFGNHDLLWVNDPLGWLFLRRIYGQEVKVYEGIVLEKTTEVRLQTTDNPLTTDPNSLNSELKIFLTHGHQGDANSDGNWFSKFFVARIWAPLQALLKINPNTPAYDVELKSKHNKIMFEWSAQQENLLLITGHTHQPIFESLTYPERLQRDLIKAKNENDDIEINELKTALYKSSNGKEYPATDFTNMKPSYFNSGCCCFNDGDITGIEISYQTISLVKWSHDKGREILEQTKLTELQDKLK